MNYRKRLRTRLIFAAISIVVCGCYWLANRELKIPPKPSMRSAFLMDYRPDEAISSFRDPKEPSSNRISFTSKSHFGYAENERALIYKMVLVPTATAQMIGKLQRQAETKLHEAHAQIQGASKMGGGLGFELKYKIEPNITGSLLVPSLEQIVPAEIAGVDQLNDNRGAYQLTIKINEHYKVSIIERIKQVVAGKT